VITTLLKKGLIENPSNDVVSVIKRRNACGSTLAIEKQNKKTEQGIESSQNLRIISAF
jgi:hypothetical protein